MRNQNVMYADLRLVNLLKLSVIIGAIVMTLLTSNIFVYASNGNQDGNDNPFRTSQSQRPSINPDFNPDESCLFDVFQLKCIPGSEQDCPKPQFSAGDPQACFPKTLVDGEWKWVCPDGYHNEDEDETGQCYPNDEGCINDTYILLTDRPGKSDRCANLDYICDEDEFKDTEECMKFCDEHPDAFACKPDLN